MGGMLARGARRAESMLSASEGVRACGRRVESKKSDYNRMTPTP